MVKISHFFAYLIAFFAWKKAKRLVAAPNPTKANIILLFIVSPNSLSPTLSFNGALLSVALCIICSPAVQQILLIIIIT